MFGHLAPVLILTAAVAGGSKGANATACDHQYTGGATELPGESLYQLPISLETSQGVKMPLSSLRGQPLLITMFYSHCTLVCPLLTTDLQNIDDELTPKERACIRVLMVSFDAERDTPAELKTFAKEHSIHDSRWITARASAGDVRLLAAALGIRYRELPDHTFNHSTVISLADKDGVVRARAIGLKSADAAFMATVRSSSVARTSLVPSAKIWNPAQRCFLIRSQNAHLSWPAPARLCL